MFSDKSTLLTTSPDLLYKCLGGRVLQLKGSLLILQFGGALVPL